MTGKRMLNETITPYLVALGFKKRTGGLFTISLAPDVIGWVGLNTASKYRAKGEVVVHPNMGVRFQDVERIVAECYGCKFHPYAPPTIGIPLYLLMPGPGYHSWTFNPENTHVAAEIAATIAEYGLPWMRSIVDIAELRRQLDKERGFDDQLMYRRIVVTFLAGDPRGARELLDKTLAGMITRTDIAADNFRKFAIALRHRLQSVAPR